MRIVDRIPFKLNRPAGVVMVCETQDDLWHLYNVIREGDHVQALTDRKVVEKEPTGHGDEERTKRSYRITMEMKIKVINVDFDPLYSGIRVNGVTLDEYHEAIEIGVRHTLDIHLNTQFLLSKASWDSIDIDRLERAVATQGEDVMAAVVLHEGVAQICIITNNMTVVKAKIETQISRKRAGFVKNHEKSIKRFLETVAKAFLRTLSSTI